MEKRFLLRLPQEIYDQAAHCSSIRGISINEYITQAIKERIEREMAHERLVIDEQPIKKVVDGMVVVNDPWYMDLFHQHKMYFFNPDLGKPHPMKYIFVYETLKEQFGKKNENGKHIRYVAEAKEIIYNVRPAEFHQVPELVPLTQDPYFWDYITLNNEPRHVILLGEVYTLNEPLPLGNINANILVGKKVSLPKVLNAKSIDDILGR